YFTQLFSTISFAVIFSSLVLYMQEQVRLSATQADLITGVYFAYNFALHMLAGYLGGRFLSYRGLVIIGLVFQLIACLLLAHGALASLYWGLACMLIGTGTMVTCLNMLLSQLFQADEVGKRQSGFLWNYSGMNIGFILGFTLAGYFQLKTNYTMLFLLTAVNNIIAMVILFSQWKRMRDKDTIFSRATAKARLKRIGIGTLIILALVPLLQVLLHHTQFSDDLVLSVGFLMLVVLFLIAFKHHDAARKKLFAFIILIVSAQFFLDYLSISADELNNICEEQC
ncbi:MFS transporter, partial [Coxiella burnetii]